MRMKINATELCETEVDYVSMVKNAATRIPFRIVKEDTDMAFDLSTAFRKGFKKTEPKPTIIGVVTGKEVSEGITNAALKAAGLEADKVEKTERDDFIQYLVPGAGKDATSNAFVVTMKHDCGLVISNAPGIATAVTTIGDTLKKAFSGYDWESTDFGSVMGSGGYCSGISTASDMLDLTIANIMQKAENPAQAATLVGAACEAFKKYISDMTSALPERAFKADGEIAKLTPETVVAVVHKAAKPCNAPDNWNDMNDDDQKDWVKKNPVKKMEKPAGGWNTKKPDNAPSGWDDMDDETKHKWNMNAKDSTKKGDTVDRLPAERPAYIPVEKWDVLVAAQDFNDKLAVAKKADPCWEGYEQVGTKTQDGKTVPNCVPKKTKKGEVLPTERPSWMTETQWAAFYKAETGEEWPQGDLTNGHGGGAALGQGTGTTPAATADDKNVPNNLGNDTATPEGALAVHKATLDMMLKHDMPRDKIEAFVKSVTFDPTKDQSVQWAEYADGKGFAAAKAPPKGTADEDYDKSIDTKLRGSLGMRKSADEHARQQPAPKVTKSEGDDTTGQVLAAIAALDKKFEGKFTEFGKSVSGLETRVERVSERAAKAEAAVSGTALGSDTGGDVLRKSSGKLMNGDGDGSDIPLLDTSINRHRGRQAA